MNDSKIKKLLKNDSSTPKAPRDELSQIYKKIEEQTFDIYSLFNIKSLSLAFCLVIVASVVSLSIDRTPSPALAEADQEELIEYILEDTYLYSNSDASYAWVDIN